jgi:hypothetical protein
MRPLFAIAPLALLLALIGPTPRDANQAIADLKAHFTGFKVQPQGEHADQGERGRTTAAIKPALLNHNGTFSALQAGTSIEASAR